MIRHYEAQGLLPAPLQQRASSKVKQLALAHIALLEQKRDEWQQMKASLADLAASCHGDAHPECPILAELATGCAAQSRAAAANISASSSPRGTENG